MLAYIPGSFPYRLMVLLHLLAAITAFAPAFVWMSTRARLRKAGLPLPESVATVIPTLNTTVFGPALIAVGVFGAGAVAMSPDPGGAEFSDTWVSIAFVLWFLMLGVLFLGLVPAERKAATASDTAGADARVNMFGGMLHLLLVLMLVTMIWQPGS